MSEKVIRAVLGEAGFRELLTRVLPKRTDDSNKSHFGHTAVWGGSKGMEGAAVLAARAASRVGSGYVTWIQPLGTDPNLEAAPNILRAVDGRDLLGRASAFVLGPGLRLKSSRERKTAKQFLLELVQMERAMVVLDAGLFDVLGEMDLPDGLGPRFVLTPHAGEAGRLLKRPSSWVDANRVRAVVELVDRYRCTVVLKGHRTLIGYLRLGSKVIVEVQAGGPQLAKAGTGDVLAGMIGGLGAQISTEVPRARSAALLGVYAHGAISDEWVRAGQAALSFEPMDLIAQIPRYFSGLPNS